MMKIMTMQQNQYKNRMQMTNPEITQHMKMSRCDNKITYSQIATKWLDVMKMPHPNWKPTHIKQKYVS